MRPSREVARRAADEALVHDGDLEEILGQCSGFQVVIIRLANSPEEAHRAGPAELKLQHAKHEALGLDNLVGRVARVHHVNNLLDRGAVDLFVLGRHEESSSSHELELPQGDDLD